MSRMVDKAIVRADLKRRDVRWWAVGRARMYRLHWVLAVWLVAVIPAMATFGARWGWSATNGLCLALAGWWCWLSDKERARRARLRIALAWAKACVAAHAYPKATSDHFRPRVPGLAHIQTSHGGNVHATVVLPPGMTLDAEGTTRLDKLVPLIASHYTPKPLSVSVAPAEDIRHAKLTIVHWRAFDGATGPIPYVPGQGIALRETGEPVHIHIPGEHTLVVGQTGAGKSSWLNAGIGEALVHEHRPDLWGVDLKRTELSPWAPAFDRLALDETDTDSLLRDLAHEQARRQKALEGRGRKWEPGCGFPPLLVVVDELTQVVWQPWPGEDPKAPSQRRAQIIRLAAMGRALGIQFLVATQEPIAEVLGRIRVNMQTTICCRVRTETDAQTALGPGLAAELRPELLNVDGAAWVVPATTKPVVARAKWLTDHQVTEIAAAHQRRP